MRRMPFFSGQSRDPYSRLYYRVPKRDNFTLGIMETRSRKGRVSQFRLKISIQIFITVNHLVADSIINSPLSIIDLRCLYRL